MSLSPKILIAGTGAIGGFYGGKLAQAGAHVSTLCRSDYGQIKKNGITITSPTGNFHFVPQVVINTIADYTDIPDYIIVATKVLPEINSINIIKEKVGPDTVIVLLQNGIDIETPVQAAFPKNTIISGLAFICVSRTDYGQVLHLDYGRLILGYFNKNNAENNSLDILTQLFTKAGVDCHTSDDIIADRWKKLIWNAPFNPLSVICGGATTKEMLESPEILKLVENIMTEVIQLSEADGHPVDREYITRNIEDTKKMEPYKTSMLLDYENKRPMEVEAILGRAIISAKRNKVNVPHIESLYGILSFLNKKNTR